MRTIRRYCYDGNPFKVGYNVGNSVFSRVQEGPIEEAMQSLNGTDLRNPHLPDLLLLRHVSDRSSDNFRGIGTFLKNCSTYGHDHSSDTNWESIEPHQDIKEKLIAKGYKPSDVIWAFPALRGGHINPISILGYDQHLAILIMNGRNYVEESLLVYGQQNPKIRRESLLGIVIFEMRSKSDQPRPKLQIDLGNNIETVVEQLHQAGYFKD